ncbi:hypothetical protein SSX86_017059 [Deinandra increscens subsp. villosa]|uniref:Gag protein n=1 Tax=Deinandra increscens subsp. villosa TaxID=3103831 RepID=A0AAP0D1M8_9ASTR
MSTTSSSSDNNSHLNTALHMLSKLTSTNYLLWRNHMSNLLTFQGLISHVDGSADCPPETTIIDNKSAPNPARDVWISADQKTVLILLTSLSDEAAAEVLNLTSARQIWVALEAAYSNSSVERIQNLKDQLRNLTRGTQTVTEFGRRFKEICDRLAAVGQSVDESDKSRWFLQGLGPDFGMFSIAQRAIQPLPPFRDLLTRAESHEIYSQSLQPVVPPVAFTVQRGKGNNGNRGRGFTSNRGSRNSNNNRRFFNRNNNRNRNSFGGNTNTSN